jgi:hypothetical protein
MFEGTPPKKGAFPIPDRRVNYRNEELWSRRDFLFTFDSATGGWPRSRRDEDEQTAESRLRDCGAQLSFLFGERTNFCSIFLFTYFLESSNRCIVARRQVAVSDSRSEVIACLQHCDRDNQGVQS